jgi:formylglycine-generating enzyme required for sulfatase activity
MFLAIVGAVAAAEQKLARPFEPYVEKIPGTLAEFEMLPIPGGSIDVKVGAAEPKKVDVKRFWMAKTEVTYEELEVFRLGLDLPEARRDKTLAELILAKTRPSVAHGDPTWAFGTRGYPGLSVTYTHGVKYCQWLSEKTGRKYRLPTEIEWEYACRAGGATRKLPREELDKVAWHQGNSPTEEHPFGTTQPVATKAPNAWGLHDMLGNAWEWCTTRDGKPVARGGAWTSEPEDVHCRARFTRISMWSINDPQDPKSTFWHTDGNGITFRVICEE